MVSENEVLEYGTVGGLEKAIDKLYVICLDLDEEMNTLADQVQGLDNYSFDPETLESSAEYVSNNLHVSDFPSIVRRKAEEELENPQAAENWYKLDRTEKMIGNIPSRWEEAYKTAWRSFGFEGQEIVDEIEDYPPIGRLMHLREEEPWRLFEGQESYSHWTDRQKTVEPTLIRHFDMEDKTSKQVKDDTRRAILDRELERDIDRDYGDEEFWREHLSGDEEMERWISTQ